MTNIDLVRRGLTAAAVATLMIAAGCGQLSSDSATDTTSGTDAQTVAATPAPTAEPFADAGTQPAFMAEDDATTAGQSQASGDPNACPSAFIGTGSYIVTNIPAGDPDGGLVGHTAPGVDEPVTGVYPADFSVFVDGTAESCHVVDSGAVWWRVQAGDAPADWVNAFYLGRYEGPGDRVAVGTSDALCAAWRRVVDARETDIPIAADLITIDVELGGHPAGVSGAIANLVNGTSTDFAADQASIDGYVGPICQGVTDSASGGGGTGSPPPTQAPTQPPAGTQLTDADYVALADQCVYFFDVFSCDQLEAAGYSADSNYGLGNSLVQAPWAFARDICLSAAVDAQLHCSELYARIDEALLSGAGSEPWLRICGDLGLAITQFQAATIDYDLAAYLFGEAALGEALDQLKFSPGASPWQEQVDSAFFAACGDWFFAD